MFLRPMTTLRLLTYRNHTFLERNICFDAVRLWFCGLGLQSGFTVFLVCCEPALETALAVRTDLRTVDQFCFTPCDGGYPSQSFLLDCFCHRYSHDWMLSGNRHMCVHITRGARIDKLQLIVYYLNQRNLVQLTKRSADHGFALLVLVSHHWLRTVFGCRYHACRG